MDSPVALRIDRVQLQERRMQAAQQFARGISQAVVARKYDVSRTTASRWHRAWRAEGDHGLKQRHTPGRPIRVAREAIVALYRPGMTIRQLQQAIADHHQVRYHRDHVNHLILDLNLRPRLYVRVKPAATEEEWATK